MKTYTIPEDIKESISKEASTDIQSLRPIEFFRVDRDFFIAEIALVEGTLIFHFYQKGPISWPHEQIDQLFSSTFQGAIKDLTGEFENKMRNLIKKKKAGERIPSTFMMDIYKEVTSDPSKIHRTFTQMTNSWTYSIRDADEPFVDEKAKKIIDGLDKLITLA